MHLAKEQTESNRKLTKFSGAYRPVSAHLGADVKCLWVEYRAVARTSLTNPVHLNTVDISELNTHIYVKPDSATASCELDHVGRPSWPLFFFFSISPAVVDAASR